MRQYRRADWELDVLEVELIAGTLKLDDERVGLLLESWGLTGFSRRSSMRRR